MDLRHAYAPILGQYERAPRQTPAPQAPPQHQATQTAPPPAAEPMIELPGLSRQLLDSQEFSNALVFIAFGIFALLILDCFVRLAVSLGGRGNFS